MEHKKKRGRKPKNNIIINKNPKFEQDKIDSIICSLTISKDKLSSSNVEASNLDDENLLQIEETVQSICWNCSQDINVNISYPVSYINDVFYLNGNFCSYECAGRHIFDNYHGKDLFEKYSLLNLYYNKIHKTCKKVKIAPEKIHLKKFGGTMDYHEYIDSSSIYNIQNNYIPPTIYVNHQYYKKQTKEDNIFKMYRKKDVKTNTLFKDIENEEKNLISS